MIKFSASLAPQHRQGKQDIDVYLVLDDYGARGGTPCRIRQKIIEHQINVDVVFVLVGYWVTLLHTRAPQRLIQYTGIERSGMSAVVVAIVF